jgi:ribosomal protein S14|nr:MAG TPA: RNA polymerase subunit [Caudoviricetes sp.]
MGKIKQTYKIKYRKSKTKKDSKGRRRCKTCGKFMGHK